MFNCHIRQAGQNANIRNIHHSSSCILPWQFTFYNSKQNLHFRFLPNDEYQIRTTLNFNSEHNMPKNILLIIFSDVPIILLHYQLRNLQYCFQILLWKFFRVLVWLITLTQVLSCFFILFILKSSLGLFELGMERILLSIFLPIC